MREPKNVLSAHEGPTAATDGHRCPLVNITEAALTKHQTASVHRSRRIIPTSCPRCPAGLRNRSRKAEGFHSGPTGVEAISTECGYAASFIASHFRYFMYSNPIAAALATVKLHMCQAMLSGLVESVGVCVAIFSVVASASRFTVQYIPSAMEFARRPWSPNRSTRLMAPVHRFDRKGARSLIGRPE